MAKKTTSPKKATGAKARGAAWREEAVRTHFDMCWEECCQPDNPDLYDGDEATPRAQDDRRERQWREVFEPLDAAGVWEILFPEKSAADFDGVYAVRERFFSSELPIHARRSAWEAAIHEAAVIRVAIDSAGK